MYVEAQYATSFNWRKFSHVLFGFVKIYFQIFSVILIFGRMFFPEFSKLRIIWIAQTVIFWQFLMYSGLQSGNFGGVIDEIQQGMIDASREFFFVDIRFAFSDKFDEIIRGFVCYKFYINELRPAITYEALPEIILLILVTLLQEISKWTSSETFKKRIREINSGLGLVFMVKLMAITEYSIYTYAVIGNYSTIFHWIDVILFAFVGVYYILRWTRMATTVSAINYLHGRGIYQEGKVEFEQGSDWAFDTYISMDTNVKVRIIEFVLFIIIPAAYTVGYEEFKLGSLLLLVIWISLTGLTFQNGKSLREVQTKEMIPRLSF